ncbi:MAG: orotidine 5'-phosphate decarboxylase / HUMPS family protein [Candidatus Babeliales bacterium]
MKLQVSFDTTNLNNALQIASSIAKYIDIIEVGTLLIYQYGSTVVEKFKQMFPNKIILADTKIVDRGEEVVPIFAQAGADWVTVMAGTNKNVIHRTCTAAHENNIKVMLDLLDSSTLGQAALEAKNLGVDALLFHSPYDEEESLIFLDKWDMIKGNTTIPIFVSAKIDRDNVDEVMQVKPDGLIIGKSIIESENPQKEAQFYYELINN